MADEASGSGARKNTNKASKHKKLSLQDLLDGVLDSSSSDEEFGDSFFDEESESESESDDEVPIQFVSGEACSRDVSYQVTIPSPYLGFSNEMQYLLVTLYYTCFFWLNLWSE